MKLQALTESTYKVRISRIMTDNSLKEVDIITTTIDDNAPNPEKQAIRNAFYRYAKKYDYTYGDVIRKYRATIIGRSKVGNIKPYINCRSCGQYKQAGPQGDTCVDCNPD